MCNDRLRLMLEVDVVQQTALLGKTFLFSCLTSMTRGLRRCFEAMHCLTCFRFGLGLDLCVALLSIIYPLRYSPTWMAIRLRAHGTEDVFHTVFYVEV